MKGLPRARLREILAADGEGLDWSDAQVDAFGADVTQMASIVWQAYRHHRRQRATAASMTALEDAHATGAERTRESPTVGTRGGTNRSLDEQSPGDAQ